MYKNKLTERLSKMGPALVVFVVAVLLSFLLPKTVQEEISSQMGILTLAVSRAISASMGFVFAYTVKEWAFPCLSLTESIKEHHHSAVWFAAVWYAVCIYVFCLGG